MDWTYVAVYSLAATLGLNAYLVQPPADNKRSSADAGVHAYSPHRAIDTAGAAFHTAIVILNGCLAALVGKNSLGTHPGTHFTADTKTLIKAEAGYTVYISEFFHVLSSVSGEQQRCCDPEQYCANRKAELNRNGSSHLPLDTRRGGIGCRTGEIHSQIRTHYHNKSE